MAHNIWTVEDKKEGKFLRKKTADFDFSKFTKKEISELVAKMREAMKAADGIGLSANQIGLDLNVFVCRAEGKFYAVFNPQIVKQSNNEISFDEGCLSVPQKFGGVKRPERVVIVGRDRNGKKIKIKAWGLLARIFQHEIDHLNGFLFTDRASNLRTYENVRKYENE